jgi:hypothetical protein
MLKTNSDPGAGSLDYQADIAMQAVCELLGQEIKKNCSNDIGMFEKCKAFVRADETMQTLT